MLCPPFFTNSITHRKEPIPCVILETLGRTRIRSLRVLSLPMLLFFVSRFQDLIEHFRNVVYLIL
ncbi:hypothetical protein ADK47_37230 [Streptomyces rimosus subsp. rimosus]|nr:hypothetical protein DF18_08130 [Streptomyces rimosus]KOT41134.1 hypothetical protein ADK84_12095 [Streptomyces sp. NRRL WC-3701]KOT45404.1 hypothetical protein ADK42_02960 [Streptomyces rimosus subsp. rimosus]KOT68984.1 hypothetical protein ADK47_37230 [Streptomyces rimosus subsp. rimosus]KUJ42941.1 hypothetical protein ADK46_02750 [Streptomyces rimosus subsp. rimosus]